MNWRPWGPVLTGPVFIEDLEKRGRVQPQCSETLVPGPGAPWGARVTRSLLAGHPFQFKGWVCGVEQILTLSSISLWQIHICKYIFKG